MNFLYRIKNYDTLKGIITTLLVVFVILVLICLLVGCGQGGDIRPGLYQVSQHVYNNVTESTIPNYPTSTPLDFRVKTALKDPLFSKNGYKFCLSAQLTETYWKVYITLSIDEFSKGPDTFDLVTSSGDTTTLLKSLRLLPPNRTGIIETVVKVKENSQTCIFVICKPFDEKVLVTGMVEIIQL